jgi:glutamate racemase
MANTNGPIGIFDSGIGGLTVASAIHRELPGAPLIYFGDTAHLPYGDKSPQAIRSYSTRITRFLIDQGCKTIVIACNTASSIAGKEVVTEAGPKIPVYNVIEPVAAHVAKLYKTGAIGVIGTKGTIKTRAYPKVIQGLNENLLVKSMATPLLVPMIEEGYFNNNISQTIINNYLSNRHVSEIQALILGCTHYPLIKKEVERFYKSKGVEVFDTASIVAKSVAEAMGGAKAFKSDAPSHHFYVSDFTESFENSTRLFFGEKIKLEVKNLWS